MIILVTGSRTLQKPKHRAWVQGTLDEIRKATVIDLVMNGGAEGPDLFSMWWAIATQQPWVVYRPIWRRNGVFYPRAGFDRNEFMCEKLREMQTHGSRVAVIAFWDGESKGTEHTINYAKAVNIPTEVYV